MRGPPRRPCAGRRRSRALQAGSRSPRAWSGRPSWRWSPDGELLEIYTALRPGRSTAAQLESWAARLDGYAAVRTAAFVREAAAVYEQRGLLARCVAGASRRASGGSSIASCSCRRIPSWASWPPAGRSIRSRSCSSRTASSCAWTAAQRADFDVIDRFVVAHGLDLDVAGEAMALDDLDARAHARRRRRAARGARAPRARPDAGEAGTRDRAARSRRADARAQEAARAAGTREPGARHEPEGEPRAARGRRGRGGAARLRRDRDDRRRRALRAAERDLAPDRLADRAAGRDDPVRGRGAPQPRAGDPRPRHLRRDAVRLRHRAGLRRRRRHAVVEGVPRRRLRLAGRQGALHLGHGLRGADGPRAGPLDALPRGALPRRGARGRLAGRPERVDLVRRARALGAGRHAGDPRRERPRRVARPRGRVRQRRDRLALRDPQDGEADGPVPARAPTSSRPATR